MATFKVGDRVRVAWLHQHSRPSRVRLGMTGTIVATDGGLMPSGWRAEWRVVLDQIKSDFSFDGAFFFQSAHLAPLTDPKADAFIEGLKKLACEPQPAVFQGVPLARI